MITVKPFQPFDPPNPNYGYKAEHRVGSGSHGCYGSTKEQAVERLVRALDRVSARKATEHALTYTDGTAIEVDASGMLTQDFQEVAA